MTTSTKATTGPFHNWPHDSTRGRAVWRCRGKIRLTPAQLDERIRELHTVRHRMLDIAMRRDLNPGELRLVRHVLRELDWYEMREAEPSFRAADEQLRQLRALNRRVQKLARKVTHAR